MPALGTNLHVAMLDRRKAKAPGRLYGMQWGDPEKRPDLVMVRRHYLEYFVFPDSTVLEIGPGGGRWTRYLLKAHRVYAVDHYQELLDELLRTINAPNMVPVRNNGTDFPGVPDASIDFLFSFGAFVHMESDVIADYLKNMRRVMKADANAVIHYADKTKPLGRRQASFGNTTPDIMVGMVRDAGFVVQDDNRWLLQHSSLVRFTLA